MVTDNYTPDNYIFFYTYQLRILLLIRALMYRNTLMVNFDESYVSVSCIKWNREYF